MRLHEKEYVERTLTEEEQQVLAFLKQHEHATLDTLRERLGMEDARLGKAILWLEQKGLIKREEQDERVLTRTPKGDEAAQHGLPEERLAQLLQEQSLSMREAKHLLGEAFNIALGILKRANTVRIDQGKLLLIKPYTSPLAQSIHQQTLPVDHPHAQELVKRGLYTPTKEKRITLHLTEKGRSIRIIRGLHDSLTPDMLRTGAYANKRFRAYTIAPRIIPADAGNEHPTTRFIQHIRRVWLSLGFEEITGNLIQTSFWNFDALYTPQDHPAREMHDTFFIKNAQADLPNAKLVRRVKQTHEHGWTTKSTGWQQAWRKREAKRLVLRTHTTVLSAQALSKITTADLPLKVFSIGTVFRNETLDWKHLFEFHQVEGIVAAPSLTFQHLKGYLTTFFTSLGYEAVRLRPAYFPYTELSVEVDVKIPGKGWMELGGAGIFRPEVVKPLTGKWIPVLAWGLGLARIIMQTYNLTDIRDTQAAKLSILRSLPDPDQHFYAQHE